MITTAHCWRLHLNVNAPVSICRGEMIIGGGFHVELAASARGGLGGYGVGRGGVDR